MQRGPEMGWVPQLVVLKDGEVIDNVLLHGKETFVLGRHQNCDIVAGHASVSRHHLEIRVCHESRELLLTDLKSVHGTKINGKQVTSLEPVAMNESDKLQIGASTRAYMVKWMAVTPEASNSSSSSFTPARSVQSNPVKGFEEEFQSSLKLNSPADVDEFEDQENKYNQNWTSRPFKSPANSVVKVHPDSARRLPFCELNARSPRSVSASKPARMSVLGSSPMSRKSGISDSPRPTDHSARKSDLLTRSPSPGAKAALRMSPAGKKILGERSNFQTIQGVNHSDETPSKLWLRRCNSNPLPAINTSSKSQPASKLPTYKENSDDILAQLSARNEQEEEEYPSDKENVAPEAAAVCPNVSKAQKHSSQVERQPFKQLFYLPSPDVQNDFRPVFEPLAYASPEEESLSFGQPSSRKHLRYHSPAENIFRRQRHSDSSDLRKQWHIVVDTNCFIDEAAFKSLKQLEGIKETRVLIPKIVIRELDFIKRKKTNESQARTALRWIESCMIKMPWWIHVQNSYETRPVGSTPPVSPSFLGKDFSQYGSAVDLLSPTNDDHILDCALLFDRSILDGRVVLLTSDTALKIKAMAEGLVSEDTTTFCDSLLSPYSERFLWAGSTAHGVRTPRSRSGTPESILPLPCSRAKSSLLEDHHQPHREEQPKGLQLVLQS